MRDHTQILLFIIIIINELHNTHRQDNGIRHKRLDSTVGETVMKHRVPKIKHNKTERKGAMKLS